MKIEIAILGSTGSIGKSLLDIIEKDQKKFDIKLLTANKDYRTLLNQAKKFNVKNLIITDQKSFKKIKEKNKNVGVSLNPETKIDLIIDLLDQIDLVLIMSVNPGFGGQKFMPEVLDKIKELKKIREQKKFDFDIEIDGGINFDNCKSAIDAGANILVSGTTVFKSNDGDIKKNINLLKLK